jgi:hypothetical protein
MSTFTAKSPKALLVNATISIMDPSLHSAEWVAVSGQSDLGGLYPEFFEADSVVLSTGTVPDDALARTLEGRVPSVFRIGDAVKPAGVKEAMESAFKIALQI